MKNRFEAYVVYTDDSKHRLCVSLALNIAIMEINNYVKYRKNIKYVYVIKTDINQPDQLVYRREYI